MNKNGFALSIVLWIVAALLFGAASLALLAKDTQILSSAIDNKLKTELMVEDVLEVFKFYELTADFNSKSLINNTLKDIKYKFPKKIVLDGRWYTLNQHVKIRVTDTSSLINTIYPSPKLIALLATSSTQRNQRYTIQDSITDWVDKDNIVSLNGAEVTRYSLIKESNFIPRNSNSIQSVHELKLINGINKLSKLQWDKLKEKIYYGNTTSTNLTLLDSVLLSSILKIPKFKSDALILERDESISKFITSVSQLSTYDSYDGMVFNLSKEFIIDIQASKGGATSILHTIIDFRPKEEKQYQIIIQTIH